MVTATVIIVNSIQDCAQPPGYVTDNTDCDDNDASISSSPEICDGIDNNCNGLIDEGVTTTYYRDADGDGWGDRNNIVQSCSQPQAILQSERIAMIMTQQFIPGHQKYVMVKTIIVVVILMPVKTIIVVGRLMKV
jgi:hypothetical protein